jgi:hypothetical protein
LRADAAAAAAQRARDAAKMIREFPYAPGLNQAPWRYADGDVDDEAASGAGGEYEAEAAEADAVDADAARWCAGTLTGDTLRNAEAVADALGHVPPDAGLRALLAEGGPVAERLALAVPGLGERITAIGMYRSTPAEPGHVAPVGDGGFAEVSNMFIDVLDKVQGRQAARAA